jgi:mannose-6-phosphate isomerase-like protein (cupin superfamily)
VRSSDDPNGPGTTCCRLGQTGVWLRPLDRPTGRRWEGFTHATDELVVVLEGEMEFEIAGPICQTEFGEKPLTPTSAIHSARNIGATAARWLYGYKR